MEPIERKLIAILRADVKDYMREIVQVEYSLEYGWPDLCKPVGADDFECEQTSPLTQPTSRVW